MGVMHRRRWCLSRVLAVPAATPAVLLLAPAPAPAPARAERATTVNYAAGASTALYSGLAFDTCTAQPLTAIWARAASPYRAPGVYVARVNRTYAQLELTVARVAAVSGLGRRLLPIYMGQQAPRGGKTATQKSTPSAAASQGTAAADDPMARGKAPT